MSIEDEARAAAEKHFPWTLGWSPDVVRAARLDYQAGYLAWAQREPSDAEIEAAAKALAEHFGDEPHQKDWGAWSYTSKQLFRDDARAALMAALSARNTRETNG